MTDNSLAPDDVPDVIGQEAARLALHGALLSGITRQHSRYWVALLARVKLGYWRTRLELDDAGDQIFVLELDDCAGGYEPIVRVHRAQLGLPQLDADSARMLATLGETPPDDISSIQA